jgi:hypothetical protein
MQNIPVFCGKARVIREINPTELTIGKTTSPCERTQVQTEPADEILTAHELAVAVEVPGQGPAGRTETLDLVEALVGRT